MSVEKFFVSRDRHIDFRRFKTRDLARFNFNFYAWSSMQCLYFIYACKIYVRTHRKITRQLRFTLALSLSECLMESFKVTLTFVSADQILWCDHSNKSYLPVLTHGAICFFKISQNEIWKFGRNLPLAAKFGIERVQGAKVRSPYNSFTGFLLKRSKQVC